jgi:quercetin dioxygenase-like cupin family protein
MQSLSVKLPGPYVTMYISDKEGDEIGLHDHVYPHSCTVVVGSALCHCDGKEKVLTVGQSIMFPAHKPHFIRPLSVGTVLINAAHGIPSHEAVSYVSIGA